MAPTMAVQAAADEYPDCAMLQACCASTYLYSQTTAGAKRAAPYLARAEIRFADLTERERVFIDAVKAGCAGDFEGALALYEQIADRWPRDVIAAKLAEFHFFQTGLAARQLELGLKHQRVAPIFPADGLDLTLRRDQPATVIARAQKRREARPRIEVGQAEPVDGTVAADQGGRVQVADHRVVLDA